MLRILKDTILCGVPVHAGETFPVIDIPESDLQIVIGAGFAERFTPTASGAESVPCCATAHPSAREAADSDSAGGSLPPVETPEDVKTDTEPSEPVKPAKTTRKRKK